MKHYISICGKLDTTNTDINLFNVLKGESVKKFIDTDIFTAIIKSTKKDYENMYKDPIHVDDKDYINRLLAGGCLNAENIYCFDDNFGSPCLNALFYDNAANIFITEYTETPTSIIINLEQCKHKVAKALSLLLSHCYADIDISINKINKKYSILTIKLNKNSLKDSTKEDIQALLTDIVEVIGGCSYIHKEIKIY